MEKKIEYQHYRNMDPKLKVKLIKQASQDEKWRKDNPQGSCKFLEQDFIDFDVYQGKQKLSLKTYRHYKSKDTSDAIGVVFMFHGLNSHMGHGAHIAQGFAKQKLITVGFDHRGFGQSPGERGYVQSLESHLYDSLVFTKKVQALYPNLPYFGLGLSMGGMCVYYLSLRHKDLFKGVILMAAAIKNIVNGVLVSLVGGLSNILHNKFKIPIKQPKGQATRNPQITDDVFRDPYAYTDKPCIKTIKMITSTMEVTPKTFPQYDANFVIIQGGLDKLVHPDGAFELYDKCKSKDKTIWFYEQMWHDIWHQQQIFQIIDKLKIWILERIPNHQVHQEQVKIITQQKSINPISSNIEIDQKVEELKTHVQIQQKRREIVQSVEKSSFDSFSGGYQN